MYDRIVPTLMLALLCCAAGADTLGDPMRPWQRAASVVPARSGGAYDLSAILYSSQRRVAVVNGRTVGEGDRIGAARVTRIERRSLVLDERGRRIRLVLATAGSRSREVE